MNRVMTWTAGGLLLAGLLWQQRSVAQQSPPKKADAPQPAGDAVAPRAGEKKSAADAPNKPPGSDRPGPASGTGGTVHTLRLPELETDLPEAKGRATVVVLCGACHTTRYITIQPPLSRQTWIAEIRKMQKTFGAPVPEDKVPEVLEYLLAVRGAERK